MPYSRRRFVRLFTGGLLTFAIVPQIFAAENDKHKIKALAFDAFPIFDPRPVFMLAEKLFPGKGEELSKQWRTRQFEYQWLRLITNDYVNFEKTTEDALYFAADVVGITLTEEAKKQLLDAYTQLGLWPDVLHALQAFQKAGLTLVFLSNMTEQMLRENMQHNNIEGMFKYIISTDSNKDYKPAPSAYQLAVNRLRLKKQEIGFVAFAGWDAAGAKKFGFPTFWVNRAGSPTEHLNAIPDWTGKNLSELVTYLGV